jgi:hypothetical protein
MDKFLETHNQAWMKKKWRSRWIIYKNVLWVLTYLFPTETLCYDIKFVKNPDCQENDT